MSPSPHHRSNLFSMVGKTVLVTGASSGFGHHFAGVFAAAGANVVLGARRTAKIQERVDEINSFDGGRAIGVALDVLQKQSLQQFIQAGADEYGAVDVLVNNAGVEAGAKTYTMIDEADWDSVLDTNLKAMWHLSKLFTNYIAKDKDHKGCIINIGSITAWRNLKGQFPYAVSKAAVKKATELMALEGARDGVRVNCLAPGYFLTDVSRVLLESERSASLKAGIPARRFGEFEDLDGPLLLLASDAASYMTGSTLVVDGGYICAEA